MRISTAKLLVALGLADGSLAFTNGTLIPAYICGQNDGFPHALGQLLPYMQKDIGKNIAFNANASQNVKTVQTGTNAPGNTAYILASFHNTFNSLTPVAQGVTITIAGNATTMIANQTNMLNIQSQDPNKDLIGLMIWGMNATDARSGSFVDLGQTFNAFPGCSLNAQGQVSGVVHNQSIADSIDVTIGSLYTKLAYVPPKCGDGTAKIMGLSVSDQGFGVFTYVFKVLNQVAFSVNNPDCFKPFTATMQNMGTGTKSNATAPTMAKPTMGTVVKSEASSMKWRSDWRQRWASWARK